MAKTKKQKETIVEYYSQLLNSSNTFFMVRPNGLTVNETVSLKKDLFTTKSSYNIVKNTLFKIALKEANLPILNTLEEKEHAVIFTDSPTETAKILNQHVKSSQKIEPLGGLLNKEEISAVDIETLANLPEKDQLIAQLLSVFNGPSSAFARVLNGNMQKLTQLLVAINNTKSNIA